jgi:predicted PurR-regulated permease PerM
MSDSEMKKSKFEPGGVARNTLIVLAIVIIAVFFLLIRDALLVAFAGVILAVILKGFADKIRRYIPISHYLALATVGLIIVIFIVVFSLLFGARIAEEFQALTEELPEQISRLQETLRGLPLGEELLGKGDSGQPSGGDNGNGLSAEMVGKAGGMIFQVGTTIMSIFSALLLIFGTGIYFAIDPGIYKKTIVLLFTEKRAARVNQAMDTAGNALLQFVSGQFIAMAFVGISVTIGLMIIGVPLALILGVIAGLADFVPIVGPIGASIPAILLALSVSPEMALYTTILFIVVQQIEGNLVTPLVQRRMVSLPPAIVLLAVFAFGLVFGLPGVILATPLAVVVMVFFGMFYVQDVLGKEVEIPGSEEDP